MAKQKYYAVQKGHKPGIYTSWEEASAQIKGFNGAVHKSFTSMEEAETFLKESGYGEKVVDEPTIPDYAYAFVDGSYNPAVNRYGYGGVLVLEEQGRQRREIILQGSGDDAEKAKMRNVAGEIDGAMAAIIEAYKAGQQELMIFYDYKGIGLWGDKVWKTENRATRQYQEVVQAFREKGLVIHFEHVDAHTGIAGNERADKLAKEAVGLLEKTSSVEKQKVATNTLMWEERADKLREIIEPYKYFMKSIPNEEFAYILPINKSIADMIGGQCDKSLGNQLVGELFLYGAEDDLSVNILVPVYTESDEKKSTMWVSLDDLVLDKYEGNGVPKDNVLYEEDKEGIQSIVDDCVMDYVTGFRNEPYKIRLNKHNQFIVSGDWTCTSGQTNQFNVSFNKMYGNHEFTDSEIKNLLKGETIEIKDFETRSGKCLDIHGKLVLAQTQDGSYGAEFYSPELQNLVTQARRQVHVDDYELDDSMKFGSF